MAGMALLAGLTAIVPGVTAQTAGRSKVTLTIYGAPSPAPPAAYGYGYNPGYYGGSYYGGSDPYGYAAGGFAVVKESRQITLKKGINEVRFAGVASRIDAGTVRFRSVTDSKGTAVVEQKFRYDLASPETLLSRYVDRDITVVTDKGEVSGTLLSYDAQQLVIKSNDDKHTLHIVRRGENVRDIQFGPLPAGLVARPTLMWKVKASKVGTHEAEVSYRTSGLSWSADYTIVWDERKHTADLSAWVTVVNRSGADFAGAKIKLMSGGAAAAPTAYAGGYVGGHPLYGAGAYGTQAQSWSGYDVFALAQTVDLDHRGSQQVELFAPLNDSVARRVFVHDSIPNYSYYPTGNPNTDMYAFNYQTRSKDASVFLEVASGKQRTAALPRGKARLYKRKKKRELELITEVQVPHTPADTPLRLRVGGQPKLEVEHKQVDFKLDERNKEMRETVDIRLRNSGKKTIEVLVREVVGWRWTDWSMESETVVGKKASPLIQEYRIKVPGRKDKSIRYTVLYQW